MATEITAKVLQMMIAQGQQGYTALEEACANATKLSNDLLMQIVQDNKDTEYGKRYGFKDIHSVEDYKKMVPFSTYDDYNEAIDRMVNNGEENLISVYPAVHYAMTSGSVDNPKKIPVSAKLLEIYKITGMATGLYITDQYLKEKRGKGLGVGRMLAVMDIKEQRLPNGATYGPISAAAAKTMYDVFEHFFSTPLSVMMCSEGIDAKYPKIRYALQERDLLGIVAPFMTTPVDLMRYTENNWEMLVRDIEKGTIDPSIKMPDELREELSAKLVPDPERAAELRAEFEKGFDTPIIPRIWPNLDYIFAIGTGGFSVYLDKMRTYSGDIPVHFSSYAASESLFATAMEMEKGEYALLPTSGFYEFLPADDENATETKTLDQLEVGKDYEIILTNLSGFYRYRIGDVVRCMGYREQTPTLCFVYRKNQIVSIAGEKTSEESISWTVKEFSKAIGEDIVDFSVYADTSVSPGRYVLLMEPAHHLPKEKHDEYRDILEEKLGKANPSVGSKVQNNTLSPTEFHFLQQETYYFYRDMMMMRGISENQLKPVRTIDTPVKEKFFFALLDKE